MNALKKVVCFNLIWLYFKQKQSLQLAVAIIFIPNKEAGEEMTPTSIGLKDECVFVQTAVLF